MVKPVKLVIATPMYGGQCSGYYTQSLLGLTALLHARGIAHITGFVFNESLVTRARNALAHTFLQTDATHLLFIDADIRFEPDDVLRMIAADLPVLCGLYPKKLINWDSVRTAAQRGASDLKVHSGLFVVNLVGHADEATVPIDQPAEIWHGGTGFMLIQRAVFERLAPLVASYVDDAGGDNAPVKEFFSTSIDHDTGRLLSEDYHFCKIWRQQGGKVHAAPWVRLAHVGTYLFEGQLPRG